MPDIALWQYCEKVNRNVFQNIIRAFFTIEYFT